MNQQRHGASDVLALAFSTSVAMWAAAYLLRLPFVDLPPAAVTVILCAVLLAGGYMAGRYTRRGWMGGLYAGPISGVLNLLVIGSVIAERFAPAGGASAGVSGESPIPIAGFMLIALATVGVSALLMLLGAAVGTTRMARTAELPNWDGVLTKAAAVSTFMLVIAGGLVTSSRAGLAVPDWPGSFGYNMFLLPLSRMDDPAVFLEHSHRLWGALTGLILLTLAIYFTATRKGSAAVPGRIGAQGRAPSLAVSLSWIAGSLMLAQGVLGGLRVVDKLDWVGTLHGVLAHVIFALVAALAVVTSARWAAAAKVKFTPAASLDRALPLGVLALLLVQLVLGATMRHSHDTTLVMAHITFATLALALVLVTGLRARYTHADVKPIRRRGMGLLHLTIVQVLLGLLALISGATLAQNPTPFQAIAATLHQANGALLLASAVALLLWNRKVLQPPVETRRPAAA